jgi:drug/metabolite transporter (DMT)-like permease
LRQPDTSSPTGPFKSSLRLAGAVDRRDRGTYAALLAVQVLFGLFPVAVKKAAVPALSVLSIRVAGAAACLILLALLLSRRPVPIRTEWPRMGLLAFLGVALNMGLFLIGLEKTTAVEAVLVITTIPVFTYALAVLLKRETLGPRRALGILLAMAGVVYLVLASWQADAGKADRAIGDLLILANCIAFAAFLVLGKPLMDRYDPLSVTAWMFGIGTLLVVPFGFAAGLAGDVAALTPEAIGWLTFIVLGPSVLTYLLNARALRHVHASTVAAFTYVQPLFAAVAAYLLLAQPLEPRILPAAAMVFGGLWLVARREPKVLEGAVPAE